MKKLCKDLRKHATKVINYEKKKVIPLTIIEEKITISKRFVIYIKKILIKKIIK